jgi:hypothetical protein
MCECKNTLKKGIMNGLGIKIPMHIISLWVFIIFHECVHRWAKRSPPSPIK